MGDLKLDKICSNVVKDVMNAVIDYAKSPVEKEIIAVSLSNGTGTYNYRGT